MRVAKSKLIKRADVLFSKIVRSRGACQRCGKKENLQCAHIIGRANKHLRYNFDNALALCYRCHFHFAHRQPLEFTEWFQTNFPIQYLFLMREKNVLETNLTMEFIVKELEKKLK